MFGTRLFVKTPCLYIGNFRSSFSSFKATTLNILTQEANKPQEIMTAFVAKRKHITSCQNFTSEYNTCRCRRLSIILHLLRQGI